MSASHPLNSRSRRYAALAVTAMVASGLVAWAQAPTAAAAGACISPADCLSKMTLAEKAGQMTQASWDALKSKTDITTYGLGSLLSGGGGGPNGAGGLNPESPAAAQRVFATDAEGHALPGMPTGTTDGRGRAQLGPLPPDTAFVVTAPIRLSSGATIRLKTMVKTGSAGTLGVPLNLATTLVTEAVLSGRRGQILSFDTRASWSGWDAVKALMPEAEISDLIVELRSATAGAGGFTRRFDHMAEVTGRAAEQIIAAHRSAAA